MVLSLLFSACKKKTDDDDDDKGNSNNTTTTSSITSIEATKIEGSSSEIATVKLMIVEDSDPFIAYELASAKYENKGFKINLPENVSAAYLYNAANDYENSFSNDIVVSEKQAKIVRGEVVVIAFNSAGKPIGYFYMESDDADADFVYTDMNFTAKGKYTSGNYTYEVNSSFVKGWNIEYTTYLKSGYLYGTAKPSSSFNWYYEEEDFGEQGGGGGGNGKTAAVRFKKDQAYSQVTWLSVGNNDEDYAEHYFGTNSGTSQYYDIPSGTHDIWVADDDDNYGVIGSYNFAADTKYTVRIYDDGSNMLYDVTNDGQKSKSLMSAKYLKSKHKYVQMPKRTKSNTGLNTAIKISK